LGSASGDTRCPLRCPRPRLATPHVVCVQDVFRLRHQLQVFQTVVLFIEVFVVELHPWRNGTAAGDPDQLVGQDTASFARARTAKAYREITLLGYSLGTLSQNRFSARSVRFMDVVPPNSSFTVYG